MFQDVLQGFVVDPRVKRKAKTITLGRPLSDMNSGVDHYLVNPVREDEVDGLEQCQKNRRDVLHENSNVLLSGEVLRDLW